MSETGPSEIDPGTLIPIEPLLLLFQVNIFFFKFISRLIFPQLRQRKKKEGFWTSTLNIKKYRKHLKCRSNDLQKSQKGTWNGATKKVLMLNVLV